MEKINYYRQRFYVLYNYQIELCGYPGDSMDEWRNMVETAYASGNEKLLKKLDKELTSAINDYPIENRREINKRIEAAVGINAEEVEKQRLKKLQTIIKRGRIKNRDEYELVHSRIDELLNNVPKDDPARKDLVQLEQLIVKCNIPD